MQASDKDGRAPADRVTAGVHLRPSIDPDGQRQSAIAVVDPGGRLSRLDLALNDNDVLARVPEGGLLTAVDGPLRVPNDAGQRDVERLLAWCDAPAFPSSRARLLRMHGRLRGVEIEPALAARAPVAECVPDLLLRQLAFEHTLGPREALDLEQYRRAYLAVRPPRYRPRGRGRATPAGASAAADLLATAIDLDGWWPAAHPDDWEAIRDAARLDALAAAATAHRAVREDPKRTLVLGSQNEGPYLLPVGAEFRSRADINLDRLRSEGTISLQELPHRALGLW